MLAKCGHRSLPQSAEAKIELAERPVAEFIRARRKLQWSQKDAAEFLGVSLTTVWRWECSEQRLPADALLRLALRAFGFLFMVEERTGT
jgi:transcriptional regulator with XRE-family HTH domain